MGDPIKHNLILSGIFTKLNIPFTSESSWKKNAGYTNTIATFPPPLELTTKNP